MGKLKRILAAGMTFVLCLSGGSAMAASGQHEVTANKLYFREEASADADVIDRLSEGTVVTVISTEDGWAKARWNGREGYLSTEYLKKITSSSTAGSNTTKLRGTGWMRKDTPMYESADDSSEEIMKIEKDTKLEIRGETMSFYYVKADGKYGYVIKSRVTMDEPETANTSSAGSSKSAEPSDRLLRRGDEGSAVKALQKELCELGYLKERYITGYYGDLTYSAVMRFQLRAGLAVDGIAGPATQGKLDSGNAPRAKDVVEMDWYDSNVSELVKKRGGTASIIDCETGTIIDIRRVGGSSHMDVEPLTAEDTEKLKKLYDGEWSWERRAVVLVAGGKYIAASINGMPHGAEISTSNDFDGQFCLHTTNSRTHGTDRVDADHQSCIEEALRFS